MAARDDFPLKGFSHLEWWVGNAFQTAQFFRSHLGFQVVGYRGPETGTRETAAYLLQQGQIRFIVTGAMGPEHPVSDHVLRHGPGVKDVAIAVPDATAAFETAVERGAEAAAKPHVLEDDHGRAVISAIQAYGDTIHSFVELQGEMPGFERREDLVARPAGLEFVDHVVANVELGKMDYWVEWYERVFGFTLLKHFDDDAISTKYTALMSKVMWDGSGIIKLPINEPAEGLKRSQIDEYLQFYRGAGVQHIAMHTPDLLSTVADVLGRGLNTLAVPRTYYEDIWQRMPDIAVDHARVEELQILLDQDEGGYLLQIFTQMLQDRPTVFFEFIERRGATGFGKGNFKALFEAIEREQGKRGNL
ncbi:MAG: 4-hydroxyphenylpyruvate dioxygenase [Actinobacteria bacterium RBG_16_68_21]|nr:MAG: 4-hydroxyphenylpyruvate dioxygenase [Actinobacteria bacterium RBG_16_68_21]